MRELVFTIPLYHAGRTGLRAFHSMLIAAALARSPRKEVVDVQSDQIRSSVCEAFAPHGFLGIEAAVIQRIADWVRATPAKANG